MTGTKTRIVSSLVVLLLAVFFAAAAATMFLTTYLHPYSLSGYGSSCPTAKTAAAATNYSSSVTGSSGKSLDAGNTTLGFAFGERSPRLWVSFSLCIDGTDGQLTEKGLGHKVSFPYREAAVEAAGLWRHVAGADVIVSVVTDRSAETDADVRDLESKLREKGATAVRIVKPDPDLGCVTESQMQRMFAYEHPDVDEEDVIVTADVDSFPTSTEIFDPLRTRCPSCSVWMWQHYHAERLGVSFPMSFLGMRASLWRAATALLWDGMERSNHWMNDQVLLTRSMLRLRMCSASNPNVWRDAKLEPAPFDDEGRCFHGEAEWKHGPSGRWRWVHFTPGHDATDVAEIAALIRRRHREGNAAFGGADNFHKELETLFGRNKKIVAVPLPRPETKGEMSKVKVTRGEKKMVQPPPKPMVSARGGGVVALPNSMTKGGTTPKGEKKKNRPLPMPKVPAKGGSGGKMTLNKNIT